jgi:membrane-bound lytic murein transglycosylase B
MTAGFVSNRTDCAPPAHLVPTGADGEHSVQSKSSHPLSPVPRPARHITTVAVVLFAALGLLSRQPAAAAEPAPPAPQGQGQAQAQADVPRADISPDLGGVAVDGPEYRKVKALYDDTAAALDLATTTRTTADATLADLTQQDAALSTVISARSADKKDAQLRLTQARTTLRSIAVASYVQGSDPKVDYAIDLDLDIVKATDVQGDVVTFKTVDEGQRRRRAAATTDRDRAVEALNETDGKRRVVRAQAAEVTIARNQAAADEQRLSQELLQHNAELGQARAAATVVGTDFALVAMDAYWKAAKVTAETNPRCGIEWWALAGITRSESRHGTYGGSELLTNGDTSKPIVGIPLNGTNETAVIADTDGGKLDGDPVYDRAVGPMQFIPETWERWKRDGNGDGVEDPSNIYDAALAAAGYLCASGPMVSDDDLTRGYLSYNHSEDYAAAVLAYALSYSQFRIPPPPSL